MIKEDEIDSRIDYLHKKVHALLLNKLSEDAIIIELEKDGIDANYASLIIQNVEADIADKKSFRNSIIMGSFYIIAGMLINYMSYSAPSNIYIIFWGIVVFGIVTIIRGFILYKK